MRGYLKFLRELVVFDGLNLVFFKTTRSYFILVTVSSLCDRTVNRNL